VPHPGLVSLVYVIVTSVRSSSLCHDDDDGAKATFLFLTRRRELLGLKTSWEEIDAPDWRKEGDEDPYYAIESFFSFLHEIP